MMARAAWVAAGFVVGVLGSLAAEIVWLYRAYPGRAYRAWYTAPASDR